MLAARQAAASSSLICSAVPSLRPGRAAGLGIALFARVVDGTGYLTGVLPAVLLFGIGLGLTVAPLTTTVLAAASDRHSGVASGVNNAVARIAQLLSVAVLPVIVGLVGDAYADPATFSGRASPRTSPASPSPPSWPPSPPWQPALVTDRGGQSAPATP